MDLVVKAILGAVVVVLIALFSRTKSYYIAGMIPLFPTFAIISHVIVGQERTLGELRETVLFGILTLLPYLVYLVGMYLLLERIGLVKSLVVSTLLWLVAAGILIVSWKYFRGI